MKLKKIILSICVCFGFVLLTGCTTSYDRDTNPGKITYITSDELKVKMDKKETFAIVFTQPQCGGCIEFKKMLETYLPTHNVTLYDVSLEVDTWTQAQLDKELEKLRRLFPDLKNTPDIYYVKDGKIENRYTGDHSEDVFDNWVKEFQMDKQK